MSKPLFQDWGLIDYQSALKKQLELVEVASLDPEHPGFIVFCSHPAVVTTGRQTKADDIFSWSGDVIEISRGGRATYHGPSQLVVYPILNLKNERNGRKPQEIRGYLRSLEKAIVDTLILYGVVAVGKTSQKQSSEATETEETGVWIANRKLASLGIAVKKWISYHGAALNIDYDPEAFKGLNPCGFKSSTMISLEEIIGKKISRNEFSEKLLIQLLENL